MLYVVQIEVLEGLKAAELKDDSYGEDLAHRHFKDPFSVFFAIFKEPLGKSKLNTLQNSSISKKISVTLTAEFIVENLVNHLCLKTLNILVFRFSIAIKRQ